LPSSTPSTSMASVCPPRMKGSSSSPVPAIKWTSSSPFGLNVAAAEVQSDAVAPVSPPLSSNAVPSVESSAAASKSSQSSAVTPGVKAGSAAGRVLTSPADHKNNCASTAINSHFHFLRPQPSPFCPYETACIYSGLVLCKVSPAL
jgi:hypothetical protein